MPDALPGQPRRTPETWGGATGERRASLTPLQTSAYHYQVTRCSANDLSLSTRASNLLRLLASRPLGPSNFARPVGQVVQYFNFPSPFTSRDNRRLSSSCCPLEGFGRCWRKSRSSHGDRLAADEDQGTKLKNVSDPPPLGQLSRSSWLPEQISCALREARRQQKSSNAAAGSSCPAFCVHHDLHCSLHCSSMQTNKQSSHGRPFIAEIEIGANRPTWTLKINELESE